MIDLALGPARRRQELFRETARNMGIHEAIIEKDFWVCLVLRLLFASSRFSSKLVFKGGTSLSKAFKLIDRFSEDIDLILDWRELGYSSVEPWQPESNTQKDDFRKATVLNTCKYLAEVFVPLFQNECEAVLGPLLRITAKGELVEVAYPKAFENPSILPRIILEIGPLASWIPQVSKTIQPYAADLYPNRFSSPFCSLKVVGAERTFWEKATILHQEFHRPPSKPMPGRYSRHYYDLYRMSLSTVADSALDDISLLHQVVEFKERFYRASWSNLASAKPGSFRLSPPPDRVPVLERDYRLMGSMFYHEEPPFIAILEELAQLERRINTLHNRKG